MKKGQRVLHLTSVHYLFDTRIFEKECASLAERGWSIELAGPAIDEIREPRADVENLFVTTFSVPKSRLARVLTSWIRLAPMAFRPRYQIVHVHDPELLPLCMLLRLFGKTVVFDMHEDIPRQIRQKHWLPRWSRAALSGSYRLLERMALRELPVVYAEDSYPSSRPYVRCSQLVRNYPSISRVTACRSDGQHRVFTAVYVGDVTEARGVKTMCAAVEMMRADGIDIELEVIGRCSDQAARELADRYANAGFIRFLDRLPYQQAMQHASKAHVGLSLLMPLPNYAHSLPTKVLEYFLLGLPVVASMGTLGGEIVTKAEGGFVVDAGSADQLKQVVLRLMKDTSLRERLAAAGERFTRERFDWDREADALAAFYRRLLGQGEDCMVDQK